MKIEIEESNSKSKLQFYVQISDSKRDINLIWVNLRSTTITPETDLYHVTVILQQYFEVLGKEISRVALKGCLPFGGKLFFICKQF